MESRSSNYKSIIIFKIYQGIVESTTYIVKNDHMDTSCGHMTCHFIYFLFLFLIVHVKRNKILVYVLYLLNLATWMTCPSLVDTLDLDWDHFNHYVVDVPSHCYYLKYPHLLKWNVGILWFYEMNNIVIYYNNWLFYTSLPIHWI